MTNDDRFDADAQNRKDTLRTDGGTTRRSVLKGATAAAAGLTLGSSMIGGVAGQTANGIPTPKLERDGNKLVDECGNDVILRGVNVVDPARANRSWRGATIEEQLEMATGDGWANNVIRLPMQPQDISGADQRAGGNTSHHIHGDNWGPALPVAFTQDELDTYLSKFVDPVVDMAASNGFYIQLDYHRHFPIFHQPQYGSNHGFNNCSNQSFPGDQGMCGERGVLWHGADQVDELKSLNGSLDDAFYETQTSSDSVNNSGGANIAEAFDEEMTLFWSTVADRYAGEPHVLFDVFNEPTGPYAGDWGSPERAPGGGDTAGINTDVASEDSRPYWELFLERAAPWVKTVEENAPGSVKTIGSPRWSQYTYWAKDTEVQDVGSTYSDITNMCYTGHRYTHENLQPMSKYFGEAADQVPMFFNEWGWAIEGGDNEFPFIDGTTNEYPSGANRGSEWPPTSEKGNQAEDYEQFFDNYPVHPVAWCFDHTWSPAFFQDEAFDALRDNNEVHAQFWQGYLSDRADQDLPQDPNNCPEPPEDTEPPTVPSNLSVSDTTNSSVTVSWSASSDSGTGVDHYQVETGASMRKTVSATEATFSGLDADTDYDVSVMAVDSAGNMSDAAMVTATTDTSGGTGPGPNPEATVSLEMDTTTGGGMAKVNVMLSNAPAGLSGYRLKVSVADTSVATITGGSVASGLNAVGQETVPAEDGASIVVRAADLSDNVTSGDQDIRLASVTFQRQSDGETDVGVAVQNIDNDNGNDIPVQTTGTTLASGSGVDPIEGTTPQDIDGDGHYMDLNANDRLDYNDVVLYFTNQDNSAVTDNLDAYDYNGNTEIDFDDVVSLFQEIN